MADSFLTHCRQGITKVTITRGISQVIIRPNPSNKLELLILLWSTFVAVCLGQPQGVIAGPDRFSDSYGSAAVAVIRRDTIVVAADSRTITDGIVNPDTTCKITVVKDVVFAATGLLKGYQNALCIVDYAHSVLSGPENTRYKLNTFQSGASSLLTSWTNIPAYRDSLLVSTDFKNGHSIHAMFCFFSGGKQIVVEYAFMPAIVSGRFKIAGVYKGGVRKPGELIWIGAMEQTAQLLKTDGVFSALIHGTDAITAARTLIQKQMEFTPRIVGGDIDIVLITPKGPRWLQRKQNCF